MKHGVIMAGGAGTRLWPLSRQNRPKHFLRFIEGKSLIRLSFERLACFLPAKNIHVITAAGHLDLVHAELPEIPVANLIGEPAVRDTANAVGLAAVLLHDRDPEGVMGIFTADHIIKPIERFCAALESAYEVASRSPDVLITLGVTPSSPHTGYGYVRRGKQLDSGVFEVQEFKEKPDLQTATRYIQSGDYYWNSGMFVWRTQTILNELARYLPQNHSALQSVVENVDREAALNQVYPTLGKISIDYGVMEKAERVVLCEMNCDWLDVGSWTSLEDILDSDHSGQILAHGNVLTLDSANNIFVGEDDHLIAALGVRDLVIVRSENTTLICHKDQVQKIKDLVGQVDKSYL